jgi:hypothetical protein
MRLCLALLAAVACGPSAERDDDGDGFPRPDDCDDRDPLVNPDAPEACNAQDDDCDGQVDEADAINATTWYFDADADQFGDVDRTFEGCAPPKGYVPVPGDCADLDPSRNPDAEEVCDGVDQDCDGVDDPAGTVWYPDADGDGFGDGTAPLEACDPGEGWVEDGTDCDDGKASVHPHAAELCDAIDQNCDGEAKNGPRARLYVDDDGDGFGNPAFGVDVCDDHVPVGYAADDTDCDDGDSTIHPWAAELCDGLDNNCDGNPESGEPGTYYVDADNDLYGDPTFGIEACEEVSGYSANDDDCDDLDAAINPGAPEICDGIDDDCDGAIDAADPDVVASTWYGDADGDGYGDDLVAIVSCTDVAGASLTGGDCDDLDEGVHPDATETCNEIDDDCDELVDDDDDSVSASTWYLDADGDLYGDAAVSTAICLTPEGYVGDATDCDDADADIHPAADEYCDGVDNDCDDLVDLKDADSSAARWYVDADADGYGDGTVASTGCEGTKGDVSNDDDCDDADGAIHPGAAEIWYDGVDQDCSGTSDDDQDGDGFDSLLFAKGDDCNDSDATVSPDGIEVCNDAIDQDCDGEDLTRCTLVGDVPTSSADVVYDGPGEEVHAGDGIAIVGDLDGDGVDDVAIGAPDLEVAKTPSAGGVYLVFGVSSGAVALGTEADVTLTGAAEDDFTGQQIASGRDATGDEALDVLVTALGDDEGGNLAGAVYVVAGPLSSGTSAALASFAFAKLVGDGENAHAGSALGAGDLDDDGSSDVVVGSDFAGKGGEVYLALGPLSAGTRDLATAEVTITANGSFDYLGHDLAVGDLDGDGVDDLFLGAPYAGSTSDGEQYVLYGPVASDTNVADADVTIGPASTTTGLHVAANGDLDGDGQLDLVVGAPFEASFGYAYNGTVYVFHGPLDGDVAVSDATGLLTGEADSSYAGSSVETHGDIDSDGTDDLAIGAVGAVLGTATDGGIVYVVYGPVTGGYDLADADARLYGEADFGGVGYDVEMGDTNGDGYTDVLIGAAAEDRAAMDAGAAFLFFGGD